MLVLAIDLRKPRKLPIELASLPDEDPKKAKFQLRPRFSIAHCIFLIAVLFRLSFKAVEIDSLVLRLLEDAFIRRDPTNLTGSSADDGEGIVDVVVPTIALVCHLAIFVVVTGLGKQTLTLVSMPNACPHLIFPFQVICSPLVTASLCACITHHLLDAERMPAPHPPFRIVDFVFLHSSSLLTQTWTEPQRQP